MKPEMKEQLDRSGPIETEAAELEMIATAMQVRSGIRAGRDIQPCI
jgi:hypothetical protein